MKRIFIVAIAIAALFSCSKYDEVNSPVDQLNGDAEGVSPVLFGIFDGVSDTKSSAGVESYEDSLFCITYEALEPLVFDEQVTKVSETTQSNLISFYLNTTKGSSETVVATNTVFTGTSGNNYTAAGGMYWPATDPSYHFYASNVQLQTSSSTYNLVSCSADQDIVYAYNASPTHKQVNSLAFNHVYGRIGTVSISAPSGYSGTLTSASITASKSGTFNVKTGSWASTATAQSITLSSSNDVWVVPGTYNMSVTFTLSDGTTTRGSITRSGSVTLLANTVNNISVKVNDSYDYELIVTPSSANINIGDTQSYTATYNTKYGSSVIASQNVTSSASWSSSNESVATISGGTATGIGSGTATLTASYLSKSATATITVADYISYYDNPTVTFSYSPNSFDATGGTAYPTISYSQVAHYASGATETLTSGGTITYEQVSAVTGFTLTASNGQVAVASNGGAARSYSVKAKVEMNGKSGNATATIYQSADAVDYWDNPVVSLTYSPNPIVYTGGSSSPTMTFSQTGHLVSGGTTTVTSGASSVSYSGSASEFSVDGSTGVVTASSNEGTTSTTYGDITASFSYSPSTIAYTGGSANKSLSYSQRKTVTRSATSVRSVSVTVSVTCNGKTGTKTCTVSQSKDNGSSSYSDITSEAVVTYSGSATGFILNTTSGNVTVNSNAGSSYTTYGTPSVSLTYNPNSFNANGGTANPTISYSQTKTTGRNATSQRSITVTATISLNGKSVTKTATVTQNGDAGSSFSTTLTSDGSVSYSGSATGFTLDSSSGVVTVGTNTSTTSRSLTVTATVSLNSKSGTGTATISQGGAVIIDFDD